MSRLCPLNRVCHVLSFVPDVCRSRSFVTSVRSKSHMRLLLCTAALALIITSDANAQTDKARTYKSPGGTTLRVLLDDTNLGREATVGELTFLPNADSGDHAHGAIEMFYVLAGELEHVVNGKSEILKPGMAGFVRPPDMVRHRTGPAGAKVLVIWVPGDEVKRITARWTKEP